MQVDDETIAATILTNGKRLKKVAQNHIFIMEQYHDEIARHNQLRRFEEVERHCKVIIAYIDKGGDYWKLEKYSEEMEEIHNEWNQWLQTLTG